MVRPLKTFTLGFGFGARGTLWSCDKNAAGKGIHTGVDLLTDIGVAVFAARPGVARHVDFGNALGEHQVAVEVAGGTVDFYAHMRTRIADGVQVKAGDKIGEVGLEGNTNTPHLHLERHKDTSGWHCGVHVNPQPSIDFQVAPVLAASHPAQAPRVDYSLPMQWIPDWWPEPGQAGSYYGPSTPGKAFYSGRKAAGTGRGWKASGFLDQQSIQTHIRQIQKAAGASITGLYDLATRDKVKRWQEDHDVSPAKGLVGQMTWVAMARAHHQ
ncbi:peptidoglycan DD-metalloendopeptidase family protein [Intrasporangium sp. YIM S08009]|uniref:peptidoglycan DD-metalloendopeptidase family protein n=1 Tax=Intrasporangium zincisolvens TaxID=3080018 RepID=UPI002B058FFE|nr:peptidoglycan DD-metalloendopeptidase family protein [Intrasporangium sp. YIM S08009]